MMIVLYASQHVTLWNSTTNQEIIDNILTVHLCTVQRIVIRRTVRVHPSFYFCISFAVTCSFLVLPKARKHYYVLNGLSPRQFPQGTEGERIVVVIYWVRTREHKMIDRQSGRYKDFYYSPPTIRNQRGKDLYHKGWNNLERGQEKND